MTAGDCLLAKVELKIASFYGKYDTETILFSGGDVHLPAFGCLRGAENVVGLLSGREDRGGNLYRGRGEIFNKP